MKAMIVTKHDDEHTSDLENPTHTQTHKHTIASEWMSDDEMAHLKPNSEMFWEMDGMEGVKDRVQICRWDRQADLFLELQPEFVLTPGGMSL